MAATWSSPNSVGEDISRQQAGSPDCNCEFDADDGLQHEATAAEDAVKGEDSAIGTSAAPSSASSISIVVCRASSAATVSIAEADTADSLALAAKEWAS